MSTDALAPAAPAAPTKQPEHLVCVQCKKSHAATEYPPRERERLRKQLVGRCRECSNKNRFLSDHGIKRSDYEAQLAAQKNCCARCTAQFKGKVKPNVGLWPGGDRKKARVHGIICTACHTAITAHHTSVEQCLVSATYLMQTRAPMDADECKKMSELLKKFDALIVTAAAAAPSSEKN